MPDPILSPAQFVRTEAAALTRLADSLDAGQREPFARAIELCEAAGIKNRIIATGIGKSGLIARKIAATLNSTGTRATYLHPAEAVHGDLGMISPGDLILALSYSGETEEIVQLLPAFARIGAPILSFTGCPTSTLAQASAVTLDVSVSAEACSLNLAPTASTTVMLALGDALALELSRRANFQPQHFADLHPGGPLGRRLARVRDLMHSGEALPQVTPNTPMAQVIHEMSHKKLGMTTVLKGHKLAGIISDGDLRRLLERVGPHALDRSAGDIMNRAPHTIAPSAFASDALALMEEKKITSLIVVANDNVEGVVHLHDLLDRAQKNGV
jgi:arabinose-5-phosphate isomerase